MNESETRAELIDPKLKACGWGVVEGSKVLREHYITDGKIQTGGGRGKKEKADYVLVYKGIKLAVVEAKSDELEVGEGVRQAKQYAKKLQLETTYSTNGKEIYSICMKTGEEGLVTDFLSPEQLWSKTFADQNDWREKFSAIPFEDIGGTKGARYYQEIAVNNTLEAVANKSNRILLTLATGTGKTFIAFQIAWKLFQTRWNLKRDGSRRPRILFLADRNILADQAYNSFSAFPEDALVRIKPNEIKKSGKVPTNGSIFFTIFQTFMSGTDAEGKPAPYFGEYPVDYFDFIIIDECHRGGANDESNWRGILEYFAPAVQLGLTATPKRKDNIDTYKYFGEPVYIYSLKEGINDGFLTPFKVKRIKTTLDDYRYTSDDTIVEGEIEEGKLYEEKDFNRTIEIVEREAKRVNIFLDEANQNEKAIIFCANQAHAALIRDLINQNAKSKDPFYCVRVTANDGEEGERLLREFQDNEKTIPTILTTSQKLSTGVDARNIRNIVLMRPVNSMIEFKQIVGRGTRLFDGKEFFTIYDFVDAYKHFSDPEWDGEPLEEEPSGVKEPKGEYKPREPKETTETERKQKIKIKLRNGKEREIKHMVSTSFWSADGNPISAEEFLSSLFGELPKLFKDEEELRKLWSNPITRKTLLENLNAAGFPKDDLLTLQKLVDMENSDLYDVLEYVFNGDYIAMTREARAKAAEATIFALLNDKQKEFITFVLSKYIETGVDELDQEKLPILLTNKYQSLEDAKEILGDVANISRLFIEFQEHLYKQKAA
ncbi:MAG: DEAD/DEAH box helicase family protein [Saprospiraceae bacterium]|jgi:type I restriction enzyme R subunit|uniref:EcoAI/FtnUII family type I restriction enzme subunit R n=1 Tax=Candidatus Brachybacter algidus TaxID=2982024 RepID=UPI001B525D7F|nr:type I restriction endonuclease subunit R [Candidatus Brachybacter algidus]MBK6449438.1 DEAD/DEAH box helicase family protein [Candidatus Brachybacter algidus]MBK7602421.1 DEAD/DEAH box helicase family protein [Candidatus Brachybacter algidus]MBP9126199.1 DEAD/DEAH box helicase family protein [Saprospiraceae bacterium]MBP9704326.1 DEAD/DEAH box helicase family protein [Chitinophagales bacterium]